MDKQEYKNEVEYLNEQNKISSFNIGFTKRVKKVKADIEMDIGV